jgi:hypothetical protein
MVGAAPLAAKVMAVMTAMRVVALLASDVRGCDIGLTLCNVCF